MPTKNRQDEIFKLALKYLYLTACRLAEVYGPHAPRGKDADVTTIDGEKAILFSIKTARRGGKYRAVAVPIQEEWALELYTQFHNHLDKNPFDIGETEDTSRKYLQLKATELFDSYDHFWKRDTYLRSFSEEAREEHIHGKRLKKGQIEFLIEDEDGSRTWRKKKTRVRVEKIEDLPKKFRIMHLREQRRRELIRKYKFSDVQERIFLGLKQDRKSSMIVDLTDIEPISEYNFDKLVDRARHYFSQF